MKTFLLTILFLVNASFSTSAISATKNELVNPGTNGKVWVYLPDNNDNSPVPIVLVPPSGNNLLHGVNVIEGDTPEHEPYVKKGYAVISFDLSGALPEGESNEERFAALNDFVNRNGGIEDVKEALNLACTKYPNLNKNEVYVAGHSSAATLSLMVAQQLPNVKAVIAYAPVINIEIFHKDIGEGISNRVPKYKKVLIDGSPHKNIHKYTMPVFLFVAKDDPLMSGQKKSYKKFTNALKKNGTQLTYIQVKNGGHYQPMIDEGIPAALKWLKTLRDNKN